MRPARSSAILALSLAFTLTACGEGAEESPSSSPDTYADGKTFTLAMGTDPGALDPQASPVSAALQLGRFAYDSLVTVNGDGEVEPNLATSWEVDGTTVTFEIGEDITCSDGSAFTAQTVVDNLDYVGNPKNESPFLGVFVPAGAKASASGSTVTLELAGPSPFVLNGLSNLLLVCDAGLKDRDSLAKSSSGTGPYTLEEAAPGDHYSYAVREDYAWGPGGATTSETGTPAAIEAKVVTNETTAANQLTSGEINAAGIIGPDAARLAAADIDAETTALITGEQWYNHAEGRPAADPAVRTALTQVLELAELQKVITSGTGEPATGLAILEPQACPGDTVSGNLPETDTDAAAAALEGAGWAKDSDGVYAKDGEKLAVTFLHDTALGSGGAAAAELAVKAWQDFGVEVSAKAATTAELEPILFGSGDWDIAWEPINVGSPDQLVPFLSGPGIADGGTNFSGIENADYTSSVEAAMAKTGAEGCDDWAAAETALFQAADVVPFANNVTQTFHKGADLVVTDVIVPTSIRMQG
jgi:peptide/nickel transport system substrate-binding protein